MSVSDSVDARMVEAAARALCLEDGNDPEEMEYDSGEDVPAWTLYIDPAETVLAALQPFRDAEQAAARQDERDRIAEDIQAIRIPVSRYLRGTQKQAAEIREEALADAIAECRVYEQAGVRRDA